MKLLKSILGAIAAFLVLVLFPGSSSAQYDSKWQADGAVNTAVIKNNVLYIGGAFSYVGRYTGSFASLNALTGIRDASWPLVDNVVHEIVQDGCGGYILGGEFGKVSGTARQRIARVRADKTLDPSWHPAANGTIRVMKVDGNTLYVGGEFTSIGGQPRDNIAAIDIPSGNVLPWNPGADGAVHSLEVGAGMIYVGGVFTNIGGQSRKVLAAFDQLSGNLTSFNAMLHSSSSEVNTLYIEGSTLYVGGNFRTASAPAQRNLLAIDINTGTPTGWSPNPNSTVQVIRHHLGRLYVGGAFTNIAGVSRRRIASFDFATGSLSAWNPNANASVYDCHPVGNTLYICGVFTSVGGQTRRKLAALDVNTNNVTSWDPNAGNGQEVFTLCAAGGSILIGGSFTSVNGHYRNNLAAIDLVINEVLPWNPNANSIVNTICVSDGGIVYAGGDFTTVAGSPRNRLVAIDASGNPTIWNPGANLSVRALAIIGNTIYAGGDFTMIGGQSRPKLAALDASVPTNSALGWNPAPDAVVRTIATDGTVLYVGGDFTNIAGNLRGRIAGFSLATHLLEPWSADADNSVYTLCFGNSRLYVGGSFTTIGGQPRSAIAALDAAGAVTAWNPGAAGVVAGIAVSGSVVYVVGGFTSIGGGNGGPYLAALDAATNTNNYIVWNPFVTSDWGYQCIAASGYNVYVGGNFGTTDGGRNYFLMYLPSLSSLPKLFDEFGIIVQANTCTVRWKANAAAGGVKYEVQRSADGINFFTIASRLSGSGSSYEVRDKNLEPGRYYYRLRILTSGGMHYSNLVKATVGANAGELQYKVWTYGKSLFVLSRTGAAYLTLYSVNGRAVMQRNITAGFHVINLSWLGSGIYLYQLIEPGGLQLSGKLAL